jgi:uncharacterized membrane protein YedE/YeeE
LQVPTDFTPIGSTLGGVLIGASAVMLMLFHGRIAGITGIVVRLLPPYESSAPEQAAAFMIGLIAAPLAYGIAGWPIFQTVPSSVPLMLVGGLLVGFGATYGGGCTSGHGVCGLALLSSRSLVATAIFMATGLATVFVTRHVIGG